MGAKIDVAIHEAAHGVIALDEGIGLGESVRMSLNDGYCHFAPDIADRTEANPSFWAPKVIKALLAGQIAQEINVRIAGDRITESERAAWAEDDRKIGVIALGGLQLDESAAAAEIDRLRGLATERIREPRIWAAIRAAARELHRCGTISGTDAEAIFHREMSKENRQ
jgi:hypothetical protein